MTIPANTAASAIYLGNGTANQFTFPFRALDVLDAEVEVRFPADEEIPSVVLIRDTDYSINIRPFPLLGGNITLIDAGQDWLNVIGNLKNDWELTVRYLVRGRQLTKYRDLGPYSPIEIEKSYDKLTMDIIALTERLDANDAQTEQNRLDIEELQEITEGLEERGGLPAGGDVDDIVIKRSAAIGDAEWDPVLFAGFSARFNTIFESQGILDTLGKIIQLQYTPPLVTLSGSSNVLREKGDVVSGITLSANVTKRSDPIARIYFRQGANPIEDYDPPVNVGSGVTTASYGLPFSDNITFSVEVTDNGDTGGPTTVTANTTYNFVYPYYFGAGAVGLTAAQVAALTKNIINSNANLTRTFTTANGDVYYFAYPASYGALTSILDINGFEVLPSWTLRTENITGLDGNPVSYRIYEFNNPVTAGTTEFTFRR